MTAHALKQECEQYGLTVEWVETYPTFLSIVPRFFFGSPHYQKLVQAVTEVDNTLARQESHRGTYLTALVKK